MNKVTRSFNMVKMDRNKQQPMSKFGFDLGILLVK